MSGRRTHRCKDEGGIEVILNSECIGGPKDGDGRSKNFIYLVKNSCG